MTTYGNIKIARGDLKITCTPDGGEITVGGGETEMDVFLYTACYLSMFGGNEDDSGGDDETYSWWGNRDELDTAKQYRSRTQFLIRTLPANSTNIKRIEEAVKQDLQWILDERIANEISVGAQMVQPKRIRIIIVIRAEGELKTFEFVENWLAMAEEFGRQVLPPADEEDYLITDPPGSEFIRDDSSSEYLIEG